MAPDTTPSLASLDRRLLAAALEREEFGMQSGPTVSALAAEFDLSESEVRRRLARGMATVVRAQNDDGPVVEERPPEPVGPN